MVKGLGAFEAREEWLGNERRTRRSDSMEEMEKGKENVLTLA